MAVARRSRNALILAAGIAAALAGRLLLTGSSRSTSGFVGGSVGAGAGRRESKVPCRGVDKALKERVMSVQKTGKLTDAMRLVAAAKVRKAQEGVEKARPFSDELQGMIKGLVKKLKGSGLEQELPMLRVPEKVSGVALVMVHSNRGLCGAYNTLNAKRAVARVAELNKLGITPKIIAVGRKAVTQINTRFESAQLKYTFENVEGKDWFTMPDTIKAKDASAVGDAMRNTFLAGEVDKVEVIYAKFVSLLKSEPVVRSVLPLTPVGIEDPEDETFKITSEEGKLKVEREKSKKVDAKEIEADVIFDQSPETILNSMLPLYLNSQMLSILFDGQASELASRMTAMKAATDNAKDLADSLTLVMNKKRQAAITQELCEISAGAMATESGDKSSGAPLGVTDNEDTVLPSLLEELDSGSVPDAPKNAWELMSDS